MLKTVKQVKHNYRNVPALGPVIGTPFTCEKTKTMISDQQARHLQIIKTCIYMPIIIIIIIFIFYDFIWATELLVETRVTPQPYHPAAQDWLPTEAKQGWAGQYLDGRTPEKTRLLLEEVLVRSVGGAHPVVCVGPNTPM